MADTDYDSEHELMGEEDAFLSDTSSFNFQPRKASIFPQACSPRAIILLLYSIIFILTFGGHLIGVPAMRIYEDIICHHYYKDSEGEDYNGLEQIDEGMCKGDEVQNQLNILLAGVHVLGSLQGIITTVPYGLLADRIGRKPVFLLSVCGMLLSLIYSMLIMLFWRTVPIRLVWLAPAFTLIGGGEAVTGMMFYAIGSDITTDANRANVFLFGATAGFAAELISPSVSSFLMLRSPWISLIAGFCVLAVGMVPALFISETLHLRPYDPSPNLDFSIDHELHSDGLRLEPQMNFLNGVKKQISDGTKRIYESIGVLNSLPIILLLIPFITSPFGRQSTDLSLRYISKRFLWKLAQTNYLYTLRALVTLVLLGVIIPAVSYILTERLHFSPRNKDLAIARVSVALVVAGSLLIAFSPTIGLTILGLVIVTLGAGFISLVRSLITTLVDKEHIARLYAGIAVVETTASLIASPALAGMYALGLKWKGLWIGLPFLGVAFIFFMGGLGVWCFTCLGLSVRGISHGNEERETQLGSTINLEGDYGREGLIAI